MSTETTSSLSGAVKTFYDRMLLERLIQTYVHALFAQRRKIPVRGGKTVEFRRYSSLSAATTPLTEGAAPSGSNLTVTQITATVAQYGDFVVMSDILQTQAIDDVGMETSTLLGEQAAETFDLVARNVLVAGTTVQYAAGRASRVLVAAGDNITATEIRKVRRTLKRNKVKPVLAGKYYACLIHPDVVFDLMADSAWIAAQHAANNSGGPKDEFEGSLGAPFHGFVFFESPNAKVFTGAGASGIDVYATLFIGKGAYGIVEYESMGLEFIYKPLGSAGSSDPLNQVSTSGWKGANVTKIIQDLAMVRLESAASA